MKPFLSFLLIILSFGLVFAGNGSQTDTAKGKVTIHRDALVDTLVQRHIRIGENKEGFNGYRIQLTASTDRQSVYRTKADFRDVDQFEDLEPYILYRQPYFKLRVGDFRSRLEAYKYLQQITAFVPFKDAFIVQDLIRVQGEE